MTQEIIVEDDSIEVVEVGTVADLSGFANISANTFTASQRIQGDLTLEPTHKIDIQARTDDNHTVALRLTHNGTDGVISNTNEDSTQIDIGVAGAGTLLVSGISAPTTLNLNGATVSNVGDITCNSLSTGGAITGDGTGLTGVAKLAVSNTFAQSQTIQKNGGNHIVISADSAIANHDYAIAATGQLTIGGADGLVITGSIASDVAIDGGLSVGGECDFNGQVYLNNGDLLIEGDTARILMGSNIVLDKELSKVSADTFHSDNSMTVSCTTGVNIVTSNFTVNGVPLASGTPGGTNGQIQYNSSGSFAGVTAVAIANGGTGQTTAANALTALLPTQSGNSGKCLTTNATAASWGTLGLTGGGTGQTTASAAFTALVPSMTSNSGKFLTNNGSAASWGTAATVGVGTATGYATAASVYQTTNYPSLVLNNAYMVHSPYIPIVTWNPDSYTWFSQGTASYSKKSAYATTFTVPYTAGEQLRGMSITASGSDITVQGWFEAAMIVDASVSYNLCGVTIGNDTNAKKVRIGMMNNITSGNSILFQYFTNDTTASAGLGQHFCPVGRPMCLKLVYDSTGNTCQGFFSTDGINFNLVGTRTSVTSDFTPTNSGVHFENQGISGLSQTYNVSNVQVISSTPIMA